MLIKRNLRVLALIASSVIFSACALLPDFGSDGMSSEEEAKLNLQMGIRYMELNMLDIAKEKLDISYDLDSSNPDVLNALAIYYERIENDKEATDFYQAAIDKAPDSYSTKNNFGRFLCDHGQCEKGISLLQASLDSPYNKQSWLTLSNMGVCHLLLNDIAQAELFFRRALQEHPGYPTALREMAKISYNKQEYMSARAFLQRYASVSKHTPETLWLAFQTERALGNPEGAETYKEQLLVSFPVSTEALQIKSAISK